MRVLGDQIIRAAASVICITWHCNENEDHEFSGDDVDDDDDGDDDEHEDQIRVRVDARLLRRVTGQLQPKDPPDTLKHQHHYQPCKVISSSYSS